MGRLRAHGVALLFAFAVIGPGAGAATAQQPLSPNGNGTDYFLTVAARSCPTYEDVTANLARNNIQESLRDLGADTLYESGEPINPATEDEGQPNCTPITGWKFTLGKGIGGPVKGTWGSLSIVTNPFSTDITTVASVPDRDNKGRILPGTSIAGATTIELTSEQANLAKKASSLWIQGGTTTDPVLDAVFPNQYGFAALRCAIDNLNGDNVEWIQFPGGSRSVYCYAYYVTPPPDSGTIIVKKRVTDPPNADQAFTFQGNISYTPDQTFSLAVVNGNTPSATFYRAETQPGVDPWTVRELVPTGWDLTDLSCTHPGGSVVVTDLANASATIRLTAGDTVTCTFTDALHPPPGQLFLSKITFGGIGAFPFRVRNEDGDTVGRSTATTTEPRQVTDATPNPLDLDAGTYRISERLPVTRGGRWHQVAVTCNADRREIATGRSAAVTISAGEGAACVFENRFVPRGSITILKRTRGAAGTTGFVISPVADPTKQYTQTATTRRAGGIALAKGDSLRRLRLGRYVIQETETSSPDKGRWTLLAAICSDRLKAFDQGQIVVRLTTKRPHAACAFINAFTPDVDPVPPEPPTPPNPSPPPPETDLVLTKRALRSPVNFGRIATFEITVRNTGDVAAEQVVVADDPGPNAQLVSATPSQGGCNEATPVICRLGTIPAGGRATIRVRVRAVGSGTIDNVAVTGSSTAETRTDNNVDRASVRVRSQGGILGTNRACPARAIAHAAC
jgi:uncharacterized repeat protein (TIGR01451 family)